MSNPVYICSYCHGPLDLSLPHRNGMHAYAFDNHDSCVDIVDFRNRQRAVEAARLDADKSAQPKTRLLSHVAIPDDGQTHSVVAGPATVVEEVESGKQTALHEAAPLPTREDRERAMKLLIDLIEKEGDAIKDAEVLQKIEQWYETGVCEGEQPPLAPVIAFAIATARAEGERTHAAVIQAAGFLVAKSIDGSLALWCVGCGSYSGYHWPKCSKLRPYKSDETDLAADLRRVTDAVLAHLTRDAK